MKFEVNKKSEVKCKEALVYLNDLNTYGKNFDEKYIFNEAETPMYFDHLEQRTMEVVGEQSAEAQHTGSDKSRFTVVVTTTASGSLLPFYVILRGLKKVRIIFKTTPLSPNIVLTASMRGTMDKFLIVDYC